MNFFIALRRGKFKEGSLHLKIGLQKAYDQVNWKFLRAVLVNFGIPNMFVNWVMECVTTTSLAVLVSTGVNLSIFFHLEV